MKHSDMHFKNAKTIFNLVYYGKSSLDELVEACDLSRQAIKNIALQFTELKIFDAISDTNSGSVGHPKYLFSVSDKIYSAYIYQTAEAVDVIHINAFGKAIDRYSYRFRKELSSKENFKKALSLVTEHENIEFCVGMYVSCHSIFKSMVPSEIVITEMKDIIIDAYKTDDEVIAFCFGKEIYVSLYGNVSNLPKSLDDIRNVVSIDKIYSIKKSDLILHAVDSLQYITIRKMIEKIQK